MCQADDDGFFRHQNKLALWDALRTLDVHKHIALIYETRAEQFDAALPFIDIGLQRGERVLYVTDDNEASAIVRGCERADIEVASALEDGAFVLTDPAQTYLRGGGFDPDRMFDYLADQVAAARAEGYTALRIIGEMTWQLGGTTDESLLEYEARLNRFLDDHDALAVCQYSRERFEPSVLTEVVRTHTDLVYGYTVAENYYFVPPEEYLDPDPERELERLLTDIVDRDALQRQLADRETQQQVLSTVLRHNIRNELNVILGNADRLGQNHPAASTEVATIRERCDRILELSEHARRIEHVLGDFRGVTPVALQSIVEHAVETVTERYPAATVTTTLDEPIEVLAGPSLDTALAELLTNAIQHNDNETPHVDLSVSRSDGAVDVTVADDGPGIPDAEIQTLTKERAIEPLFHGSGLGLWLVHWVVSRSFGALRFDERDAGGSTVTVRLATANEIAGDAQ